MTFHNVVLTQLRKVTEQTINIIFSLFVHRYDIHNKQINLFRCWYFHWLIDYVDTAAGRQLDYVLIIIII